MSNSRYETVWSPNRAHDLVNEAFTQNRRPGHYPRVHLKVEVVTEWVMVEDEFCNLITLFKTNVSPGELAMACEMNITTEHIVQAREMIRKHFPEADYLTLEVSVLDREVWIGIPVSIQDTTYRSRLLELDREWSEQSLPLALKTDIEYRQG